MTERVKSNNHTNLMLLCALVRYGSKPRLSIIAKGWSFPRFTTGYQLRKALKALIEDGYVETDFEGYNRYGYTRYFATEKGINRVGGYSAAKEAFLKWLKSPQESEDEFNALKGLG